MDWILELVGECSRWGSLALLAWGGVLCLEETLAQNGHKAGCAAPAPGGAAPAHAGGH